MEATVVDLRYRMNDVLKALERNEPVTVLYHGKPKGVIRPVTKTSAGRVKDHVFFGSRKSTETTEAIMNKLREGRYRAL